LALAFLNISKILNTYDNEDYYEINGIIFTSLEASTRIQSWTLTTVKTPPRRLPQAGSPPKWGEIQVLEPGAK
jgi:hypothetical protein